MNAVEEIQAAIVKLTAERSDATRGPWYPWHPQGDRGLSSVDAPSDDPDNPEMVVEGGTQDVDLIVTLHRTIDAQIALLSHTVEIHAKYVEMGFERRWESAIREAGDLDLARAINGPTS